jgi:hypothetical protein
MPELTRARAVARWRRAAHRRRLALACLIGAASTGLVLALVVPAVSGSPQQATLAAAQTRTQDTTYVCLGS